MIPNCGWRHFTNYSKFSATSHLTTRTSCSPRPRIKCSSKLHPKLHQSANIPLSALHAFIQYPQFSISLNCHAFGQRYPLDQIHLASERCQALLSRSRSRDEPYSPFTSWFPDVFHHVPPFDYCIGTEIPRPRTRLPRLGVF
jgi:hypothetical protein